MPTRPTSIVRTANFLGLNDDLPIEIGEDQGSTLTNWYKQRRKLVRRKGQSFVAEAAEVEFEALTLTAEVDIDELSTIHLEWEGA